MFGLGIAFDVAKKLFEGKTGTKQSASKLPELTDAFIRAVSQQNVDNITPDQSGDPYSMDKHWR